MEQFSLDTILGRDKNHRMYRILQILGWMVFFLMAYVICLQVKYSDGDDAFFYDMAQKMGFWEYIRYRYITWEGRATSEAMTWIAFHLGIGFWRVMNAAMLTLLPMGLVHLAKKMMAPVTEQKALFMEIVTCLAILFMDMEVIGYSSVWMTGSTFYLWSIICGIWAAMPFVDLAMTGSFSKKSMFYALPLGFIAAMGLEQIAAVDIAFGMIILVRHIWKNRNVPFLLVLQEIVMIAGLVVLFISPGTSARSADEIATWMPQYATMSFGEHIFITLQFLCSTLANQSRMFLIVIWIVMAANFNEIGGWRKHLSLIDFVLILTTAWSYTGHKRFSEMGMGVTDITQCVTNVATWDSITMQNKMAIVWWCGVMLVTLFLLWNIWDNYFERFTGMLLFLSGIACTLIMYFTPTIYASGGRVLFMMEIMFWLLLLYLLKRFHDLRSYRWFTGIFAVCGVIQLASGVAYMLSFF